MTHGPALPWLLAFGALAFGAFAPALHAEPKAQTRFSLELATGSGCPDASDFVREVIARVPTARQVDGEPGDVGFHIEISSSGVSSLTVTLPQGSSRRELRDVTCEEATATFVLIAALVLDARPEERLEAIGQAGEPAEVKPAPETKPPEPPPMPAKPSERKEPPPPLRTRTRGELHVGFDAGLGVESAVAPTPPPAGLLGIGLLWDRFSVWSPELRGEFLGTTTSTYSATTNPGNVTLHLLAGRLSACPLRLRLTSSVHLAACGTFDAGRLYADGAAEPARNITAGQNKMTWLALGLAARGELRLSQAFNLELVASARGLINNDIFTVQQDPPKTDLEVYNVPALSVGLQAGIGVRL